MILDDLKAFLVANNLATSTEIKFDFDSSTANGVVLWQYDGIVTDLGSRPAIQIAVKDTAMVTARTKIQAIYDALYPKDQFQKVIEINGKNMHITPRQEPFFNEKDASNRYIYIFNIIVNLDR
jgi:hypothetical protein